MTTDSTTDYRTSDGIPTRPTHGSGLLDYAAKAASGGYGERPPLMQMYPSGRWIDVYQIEADDICIQDIAWALSHTCRYGGSVARFYSVAEHSVRVATAANIPRNLRLTALLHDATEAYLGDVIRGIKHRDEFAHYRDAEARAWQVIAGVFGLVDPIPEVIDNADKGMLYRESSVLKRNPDGSLDPVWADLYAGQAEASGLGCHGDLGWSPEIARELFLRCFHIFREHAR